MRLFLLGAATLVSAGTSFGAVFQTVDLGSGADVAHMVVQFTTGDAVQFNYAYVPDADNPLTGLALLSDIQNATAGTAMPFTFTYTEFSFGDAIDTMSYNGWSNGPDFYQPDGYWHYWTKASADQPWKYSDIGMSDRTIPDGAYDGWTYSDASPVPEPASLAFFGLAGAWLMRRRRAMGASVLALATAAAGASAQAAVSVTVVSGSYTQGTVKASLATAAYQNTATNLHDFALTTGGSFPISLTNANFSGGTLLAFGDGGGVTLKFDTPVHPLSDQKEIGLFTAQMLTSGGGLLNGNMQAAVLVSGDGAHWRTLDGAVVADPVGYTATSHELNAPSSAYIYTSGSQSAAYGFGTTAANLAALTPANFQTPMLDDSIFNDPILGTNAARTALLGDGDGSVYASIYGTSGGGNWFDISNAGLASVQYLRLNGINTDIAGGIRLDSVFANAAAVPEPVGLVVLAVAGLALKRRR